MAWYNLNAEEFTCKQIDCSDIKHRCGLSSTIWEQWKYPYDIIENNQCDKCVDNYFQDTDAQEFTCITNGFNIKNCLKCATPTKCAQCQSPFAND